MLGSPSVSPAPLAKSSHRPADEIGDAEALADQVLVPVQGVFDSRGGSLEALGKQARVALDVVGRRVGAAPVRRLAGLGHELSVAESGAGSGRRASPQAQNRQEGSR